MIISPAYAEQNRQLHLDNEKYGISGEKWAAYIERLIAEDGHATVLDYGSGKGRLAQVLQRLGISINEYDPAIPGKDELPEPADLVICSDVLEHIEPESLEDVLEHLAELTKGKLFFDIHTAPARKILSDGRNAHLIVQQPDWWRFKITRYFDIVYWVDRPERVMVYGEAVPKGRGEAAIAARKARPQRRKMTPELSLMCARLLKMSDELHDELTRIRTIRMFELVDNEPADMQIVWDVLDDVEDPRPMLKEVSKLASKSVIMRMRMTAERNEQFWRPLIEEHWHIFDWQPGPENLGLIAFPKVTVAGVHVVGAVDHEQRWKQIEASMSRVAKRIELKPAHARRAILACYGPSLRDMIGRLKDEVGEAECDVVSVSGAHDFLLANGIVPTYHAECDPRPHKADNIDKAHDGVKYLIASVVHPVLFDKLEGHDVALWHVADQEHAPRLMKAGERGNHMITGGGSVGLRSVALLYAMGYRDFSIYGMDCSFAGDGEQQWAGKHAGKRQEVLHAQCGGRAFATSRLMLTYATDFIEMIQKMQNVQIRVYGEGLLQTMCGVHAQLAEKAA